MTTHLVQDWMMHDPITVTSNDILAHYPVQKVMSLNPIATSPDTPLIETARLMREKYISTLPVMKGEKLGNCSGWLENA